MWGLLAKLSWLLVADLGAVQFRCPVPPVLVFGFIPDLTLMTLFLTQFSGH